MNKASRSVCLLIIALSCILSFGCRIKDAKENTQTPQPEAPHPEHTPSVFLPSADGVVTYGNASAAIDASHSSEGYIMVRSFDPGDEVKLQISGPDQKEYYYFLSDSGDFEAIPLVCGSGTYQIQILKQAADDTYVPLFSQSLDALVEEPYIPFLYPNQYVKYTTASKAILKGSELASDTASDLEILQNIYQFVTENITCDAEKTVNLSYSYLPNIDKTFESGTGNCFDLATIMTAMLRSQKIPAKLELGYADQTLHAWISVYLKETGWTEHIICFNGTTWKLEERKTSEDTHDHAGMKMTFTY